MKLSDTTEVKELFKLNEELGRLIDCRVDLNDLDIYHIPYIEFKNGEYSAEVLERIEDQSVEPLLTGEDHV